MKNLAPHHAAWLAAHPHRTAEWLNTMLADGFDVHHLDGVHQNNDPNNLVLIEHTDHMMIHGGRTMGRIRTLVTQKGIKRPRKNRTSRAADRALKKYEADRAKNWGLSTHDS